MMFWYGGHWVFWQAALMGLAMVAFWTVVIWAVYYLVTTVLREQRLSDQGDSAKAILDERLAKVEIDADEYRRLRDVMVTETRTPVGSADRR